MTLPGTITLAEIFATTIFSVKLMHDCTWFIWRLTSLYSVRLFCLFWTWICLILDLTKRGEINVKSSSLGCLCNCKHLLTLKNGLNFGFSLQSKIYFVFSNKIPAYVWKQKLEFTFACILWPFWTFLRQRPSSFPWFSRCLEAFHLRPFSQDPQKFSCWPENVSLGPPKPVKKSLKYYAWRIAT